MKLKHPFIMFIGISSVLASVHSFYVAMDQFLHPDRFFFPQAKRWYEFLIEAILSGIIACGCMIYQYRDAKKNDPISVQDMIEPKPLLWKERQELRMVLYAYAIFFILLLPVNIAKGVEAAHAPGPFPSTFSEGFSTEGLVCPWLGLLLIVYDRYRIVGDIKKQPGICRVCGYDLRATPDRCPECGTIPQKPVG